MSATRNEAGEWCVDPAELFRVYAPLPGTNLGTDERREHSPSNEALTAELEGMRRQIDLLKDERDDLRRRLDQESEERRRLTALLTHQPEPARQEQPHHDRLYEKLFGRRGG